MTTKLIIGKSKAADPRRAAEEAAGRALEKTSEAVFALVFSTDQYDAAEIAGAVSGKLGKVPWAGCCTAGVFAGSEFLKQGLVVGLFSSDSLRAGIGVGGSISLDPRKAGETAMAQAMGNLGETGPGRHRAFMVMPDAFTGNAAEVLRGAVKEAGTGGVWVGGGSGDNLRFVRTAQFAHGRAWSDHVVVIALDSPQPLDCGIEHGWRPYGPPSMVTRSKGSVVATLDYQEAFEVYRRTAAARGDIVDREKFAVFAMTHPLGIPQSDGSHIIRDPLAVEPDGGLRCVAEVPQGSMARLMEGGRESLLAAARTAATASRAGAAGPIGGAVVFDCVSRSLILQSGMSDELAEFQAALGGSVPMMGCLTFGEVGGRKGGIPQYHNKTAVVLSLPA